MDNEENNNVFRIVPGGATEATQAEDDLPVNGYVITDIDGSEFYGEGFLVFTSQHVAIMKETAKGAIPLLVIPLHRVKVTELVEDDEN